MKRIVGYLMVGIPIAVIFVLMMLRAAAESGWGPTLISIAIVIVAALWYSVAFRLIWPRLRT